MLGGRVGFGRGFLGVLREHVRAVRVANQDVAVVYSLIQFVLELD